LLRNYLRRTPIGANTLKIAMLSQRAKEALDKGCTENLNDRLDPGKKWMHRSGQEQAAIVEAAYNHIERRPL